MKNRFLRTAVILATAATLFYSGCGDNGASSDVRGGGNVDALINRTRGTNDPKAPELYTLSVTKNPESGGSVSKSPDKEQYTNGESVLISATPETGYRFTGWSGSQTSTNTEMAVTMNGNKELIANFLPVNAVSYTLNIIANPETGGATSKSPDKLEYAAGEAVYVTATAGIGYRFAGWSGSLASQNTEITVTMDDNKELVANFVPVNVATYTLTVNANPAIGGIVSKSPNKSEYTAGETVTVTATTYSAEYTFTGWSGASSSTNPSVSITMDGDKTLTANFQQETVTPTTSTVTFDLNGGSGIVYNQTVNAGYSVTLPSGYGLSRNGYTFDGWNTGTGTNYNANSSYTPTANITLYAKWNWIGKGNNINNYKTIQVGSQIWMAENLDYDVEGSKCYDNNSEYCEKYGRLYNWATAMENKSSSSANPSGVHGVCPAGWHLPLDDEWQTLVDYVGGWEKAGTKLKSQTGWNGYIYNVIPATDDYGWSALPGGYGFSDGRFDFAGSGGYWWSATTIEENTGWARGPQMSYSSETVSRFANDKAAMLSVRCVQDVNITLTFNANGGSGTVPAMTVNAEGSIVTLPNGSGLSRNGYKFFRWNTSADGKGTGYDANSPFTARGNVTLYAIWREAFVDSRDGKSYAKVAINTQTWMAENLNYNASGSKCYDDNPDNCEKYGRLYNWATAMNGASSSNLSPSGVQGVCPTGWYLPSDDEWQALVDYVGGSSTAGTKLKSTSGWYNNEWYAGNGTDDYGFSALPGGVGRNDGSFYYAGEDGYWWSATEVRASIAYSRGMDDNIESVDKGAFGGTPLLSVRCVQDD